MKKVKVRNVTGMPQVIRIPGDEVILGASEVAVLPEKFAATLDEKVFRVVREPKK